MIAEGRRHGDRRGPVRSHEDGAVAVVVAISLLVMIGAAALAIDLGAAWSTKRDLVIDLDSASLAGARTLAEGRNLDPDSCPPGSGPSPALLQRIEAATAGMFAANGDEADLLATEVDCDRSTVTVRGSQESTTTLAPALGVDELTPGGYSIARTIQGEGGELLPVTLCLFGQQIQQFLGAGQPANTVYRLPYAAQNGFQCGDDPSNYGWWPSNSAAAINGWINNGLPVSPTLPPSISCDLSAVTSGPVGTPTQDGYCIGGPGNQPNLLREIDTVYGCGSADSLDCRMVTFLIHNETFYDGNGSCGNACEYRPYAFLDAIVRGVVTNGPQSGRGIDLEFVRIRTGGDDVPFSASSSFMCSADGAPAGDPNCDA
jgi:hypothetical protein